MKTPPQTPRRRIMVLPLPREASHWAARTVAFAAFMFQLVTLDKVALDPSEAATSAAAKWWALALHGSESFTHWTPGLLNLGLASISYRIFIETFGGIPGAWLVRILPLLLYARGALIVFRELKERSEDWAWWTLAFLAANPVSLACSRLGSTTGMLLAWSTFLFAEALRIQRTGRIRWKVILPLAILFLDALFAPGREASPTESLIPFLHFSFAKWAWAVPLLCALLGKGLSAAIPSWKFRSIVLIVICGIFFMPFAVPFSAISKDDDPARSAADWLIRSCGHTACRAEIRGKDLYLPVDYYVSGYVSLAQAPIATGPSAGGADILCEPERERTYTGPHVTRIRFPAHALGTGSICYVVPKSGNSDAPSPQNPPETH